MRILFLYTELATYFLKCVDQLERKGGTKCLIVSLPVNPEAPFDFSDYRSLDILSLHSVREDDLLQRIRVFEPDLIYVSGWSVPVYRKIAKTYRPFLPVVLGLDNPWDNSLKQRFLSGLFGARLRRLFTDVWIPGKPQLRFAQALGFQDNRIHTGVYCADVDHFNRIYDENLPAKQEVFPRRFLFCARYIPQKNLHLLCEAFIRLKQDCETDWELWCVGTGELFDSRIEYPGIRHVGFVQPAALGSIIRQTGVYVLPSRFEPWAVSVHEFAAAGLPLLLSKAVGAGSLFLEEGKNGHIFETDSLEDLVAAMKRVVNLSNETLNRMSRASHLQAQQLTPAIWGQRIRQMKESFRQGEIKA